MDARRVLERGAISKSEVIGLRVIRPVVQKTVVVAWLLLSLSSCGLPAAVGPGYVRGTVLGWPSAPQGGGTIPARNAKVRFFDASRLEVASATTDDRDTFEVPLAAGRYQVDVLAFGQNPIIESANRKPTKTIPVYVTVTAGETSTLDLVVSTGIL